MDSRAADEMRPCRTPRNPHDGPARVGIPIGGAHPDEGRHEEHFSRVLHRTRQNLALGRIREHAHLVAQPLDNGSGYEDRPLEGVGKALAAGPRLRS